MADPITQKPVSPWTVRICAEDTFGTHKEPAATDALVILNDSKIDLMPMIEREFVNESRGDSGRQSRSAGVQSEISGSIHTRLRGRGTAGLVIPAFDALLESGCGFTRNLYSSKAELEVISYAAGGTETITITLIQGNGETVTHTLTNGTDFTAASSNSNTATLIAAAIDAKTGVSATASGAYVTITLDKGYRDIHVASSAIAFVDSKYKHTAALTVADYTAIGTDTLTFVVTDNNGTATTTTLTAGTSYSVGANNDATATNLEVAVEAITGITATVLSAVVTATLDPGYRSIAVTSSDPTGVAVTYAGNTPDADDRVLWTGNTAAPAAGLSLEAINANTLTAIYGTGMIVQSVEVSEEPGKEPDIAFNFQATRWHQQEATTLGAAIESTDGTSITLSNPDRFRDGLGESARTGLPFYIQIDSEIMALTALTGAVGASTGTGTVTRGQKSTSGATHSNGATVTPYMVTASYYTAGVVVGAGLTNGYLDNSATATRLHGFKITDKTGRAFDELYSGATYPDSLQKAGDEVDAQIKLRRTLTNGQQFRKVEAGSTFAIEIPMGGTDGSKFGVVCPVLIAKNGEGPLEEKPTLITIDADGADNVAGTSPGLSGQFQFYAQ